MYHLTYADFDGEHGRDPQTFILNGPRGERWYFRAENYGYAYAAELAARRFMLALNGTSHPLLPPETLRYTLDELLGEAGKRP